MAPGTALVLTLPQGTTTGNHLIVAVSDYYASAQNNAAFSVQDAYGNAWRTAIDYQPGGRLIVFYAENVRGGGNHQITVTSTVKTYSIGTVVEYAGVAASNSLDITVSNRARAASYTSSNGTTRQGVRGAGVRRQR